MKTALLFALLVLASCGGQPLPETVTLQLPDGTTYVAAIPTPVPSSSSSSSGGWPLSDNVFFVGRSLVGSIMPTMLQNTYAPFAALPADLAAKPQETAWSTVCGHGRSGVTCQN